MTEESKKRSGDIPAHVRTRAHADDLPRPEILIVDDRVENLVALRQILKKVDAEIVEATNGNDALAATLDHDFALAILDVQMPEMDGYDLAGFLRGDPKTRRMPIIFMTAAYNNEEQVFKGYEVGAVDYIVKPYNPDVLLSKVGVFMDLYRTHAELNRKIEALSRAEEELRGFNESLEHRVAEGTAELRRKADQLRALASQLSVTEQHERRRIARVLHDHIQQLIVAARMQVQWMEHETEPQRLQERAQSADGILLEALEASRSLTVDLSPPVLYHRGLVGALSWLGNRMRDQHHFSVELHLDEKAEPSTKAMCFFFFECARELLFNAVKHSGTLQAQMTLRRTDEDCIELTISDRGKGFDPETLENNGADQMTFGLFSIQERLAHIGGRMKVETSPGKGTTVTLVLPADSQASNDESVERGSFQKADSVP